VERIRRFQRDGVTILLVSHDHRLVADLCDEVVWLRGGTVIAIGDPRIVVARYLDAVEADLRAATPADADAETLPSGVVLLPLVNRFGTLDGRVVGVRLLDQFERDVDVLDIRGSLTIDVEVDVPLAEGRPVLAIALVRDDGLLVVDSSTELHAGEGRRRARLVLERLDVSPGRYAVSVGLHAPGWGVAWDRHERAYPFTVAGEATAAALFPPLAWEQESAISPTKWVRGWGA
jgi:lipopolysaccharide transport system ATP-binding protein